MANGPMGGFMPTPAAPAQPPSVKLENHRNFLFPKQYLKLIVSELLSSSRRNCLISHIGVFFTP